MDSDNYCSGMRMRRGTNMKEKKFVIRFPSASDAFYSLTCNQNDILYIKLTVLFLQCVRSYYHLLDNLWFLLLYERFFVHDYVMLYNSVCTSVATWFLCAYQYLCT